MQDNAFLILAMVRPLLLRVLLDVTLLDTGLLAGEVAEVVKLRTTHLTILVDCD